MLLSRHRHPERRCAEGGAALATVLHVVLLLLVLGQIVFLASRNRVRLDLTSDKLWTTTSSTRALLDRLDQRLLVEAYFSPKDKLPVLYRTTRTWADSFLDELVQLGKGKVIVKRFDPNADKAIADKATRVGVKPLDLRSQTATSASLDRHWQGLRLVYGGDRNRVIAQFTPVNSFIAEAIVTPAIKEVATTQKRRIGYMEWPAVNPSGPQGGSLGWNQLRTLEPIAKRYEFQNLKDEDGALLPDDLGTLFLFRPKDLTDRQKYVLDQFLVKGGTLVAFVDAVEYTIGNQRLFTRIPVAPDASGSQVRFTDQLLHYGLEWKPRLVADLERRAHSPADPLRGGHEYFALVQQTGLGFQQMVPIGYPYFFHAVNDDWSRHADELAKDEKGQVDKELAAQYRKVFVPGMPSDEFVFQAFKGIGRGPGFYWPTWVGLRSKAGGVPDLPPGVEGRVLLWSSPAALVEDPPQTVNPLGHGDALQRQQELIKFNQKLMERFRAEPRLQVPLMSEVKGAFTSFFAGMERPQRPSEIKEAAARAAEAKSPDPDAAGVEPGDARERAEARTDADQASAAPKEPAMVVRGDRKGRIVLIGDSDFVRDDLVRGDHAQVGGPVSGRTAGPFFAQLLDWLAEDSELVALQSKASVDRSLQFLPAATAPAADPRLYEQELRAKTNWLRTVNVVLPGGLLAAIGLLVFLVRRAQKRSFLSTVN
jgi:ABC-type uncharacterized transport system involved in gliding motility auxiliary subunit